MHGLEACGSVPLKPPTVSAPSMEDTAPPNHKLNMQINNQGTVPSGSTASQANVLRRLHWSPKGSGACRSMEDPVV